VSPLSDTNREDSESRLASIRLLLADDQPRVRQSLEALLTALCWRTPNSINVLFEIVGVADDGQGVIQQAQALHPDVVVLDLPVHDSANPLLRSEETLDGLTVIRIIKREWPEIKVVVLTMYATNRSASLLAGADAFLLKGCPTRELVEAVIPG
jgi:DNA-binding NarL/FixJ family response regulator